MLNINVKKVLVNSLFFEATNFKKYLKTSMRIQDKSSIEKYVTNIGDQRLDVLYILFNRNAKELGAAINVMRGYVIQLQKAASVNTTAILENIDNALLMRSDFEDAYWELQDYVFNIESNHPKYRLFKALSALLKPLPSTLNDCEIPTEFNINARDFDGKLDELCFGDRQVVYDIILSNHIRQDLYNNAAEYKYVFLGGSPPDESESVLDQVIEENHLSVEKYLEFHDSLADSLDSLELDKIDDIAQDVKEASLDYIKTAKQHASPHSIDNAYDTLLAKIDKDENIEVIQAHTLLFKFGKKPTTDPIPLLAKPTTL